jgi:hypothetical protein
MTRTTTRARPTPRAITTLTATLIATLIAILAAGCGQSSGEDVASAGGDQPNQPSQPAADEQAQVLAFAECMRDNGIDMPDPGPGQQGLMTALQQAGGHNLPPDQQQAFDQAYTTCQPLLPAFANQGHGAPDDDTMLALAECLREQGLDVPDDLYSGGALHNIPQDELNAAMEACREVAGFGEEGH